MRLARAIAVVALVCGGAAVAQEDIAEQARTAVAALSRAADALAEAETAPDRIAALTETIRAYEAGLAAMREDLRNAALRERDLEARLAEQDTDLSGFLVLLQQVSASGGASTALHPGNAVETVRAGILASALVPALKERSAALEADLADISALRTVREAGTAVLSDALDEVREARVMLSAAMSERTDLPPSTATDDAAMEALINSSETLAAFADSLASGEGDVAPSAEWAMPVLGRLIRGFDEADAAGVRRPGWLVSTASEALVTAPASATVRFSGEVPGSGPVIILETSPGQLVIFTGHEQGFVRRDQIVAPGEPIALMSGGRPPEQENLNETVLEGGQPGDETLYIEIRQGQAPVDPAAFLRPSQE